jgi:5'-3' exonuclease
MKNVNIFDFNNLAVRVFFSKDVEATSGTPNIQLWKYSVINSIYLSLFKDDINEVILAVDFPKSWRKLYWNRYKESRKPARDKSPVDWNIFHDELNKFRLEIEHHLPFKILSTQYAEADDIIGIICRERQESYTIISTDEDYLQLCSDNVKIYNPNKTEFMECDDPEMFIVTKSLMGQPKDDIFNIKTPLDHPVGQRKPGFGIKSAEKVIKEGYKEWLKKENLEERYRFNRNLIDFSKIPSSIKFNIFNILKKYDNYKMPDPSKIYTFFNKNKFTGFLEEFTKVEGKLLELY